MKAQVRDDAPGQARRRPMWKEVLVGAFLLWIGIANLAPALGIYDAHRGTVRGVFLLVCECLLMVGSGTAIVLGARPFSIRREEIGEIPLDWGGINATRLRRLALVSFLGLAWCLGSLR
jgi:hypothetical protein